MAARKIDFTWFGSTIMGAFPSSCEASLHHATSAAVCLTKSRTLFQISAGSLMPPNLAAEPGPRITPVSIGSCTREAEHFGRLLDRQAGKHAELHQLCGRRIFQASFVSASSKASNSSGESWMARSSIQQVDSLPIAAVLQPFLAASIFDQDPPHGLGGRSEEMSAAVPMLRLAIVVQRPAKQSQVGFMNQSRGVERLARLFVGHFVPASRRSSAYTNDSNCSAACGSPCSTALRITVNSLIDSDPRCGDDQGNTPLYAKACLETGLETGTGLLCRKPSLSCIYDSMTAAATLLCDDLQICPTCSDLCFPSGAIGAGAVCSPVQPQEIHSAAAFRLLGA